MWVVRVFVQFELSESAFPKHLLPSRDLEVQHLLALRKTVLRAERCAVALVVVQREQSFVAEVEYVFPWFSEVPVQTGHPLEFLRDSVYRVTRDSVGVAFSWDMRTSS